MTRLRIALAAAAAALLAGCGQAPPTGADGAPLKVFNYVNLAEPKRLDPAFSTDVYEGVISGFLFSNLVQFDEGTGVEPAVAERWEVSEDGRTYRFFLRDAKFSDGTPIESKDVRYSFTRVLWPDSNSDRTWLFDKITGADEVLSGTTRQLRGLRTPSPREVEIELVSAYPAFLTKLCMPSAGIIPENSAGADKPDRAFDKKPISSGPWVLTRWQRDQRLEFERNEHYWGPRLPLDRLIYHIQNDSRVQHQQFEIGKIDLFAVPFTLYPQWIADPVRRETLMPVQELNTYFLAFMNSKPKFQDKRVRQAISYAVDGKKIFEDLQKSRGERARGPVPPGIAGFREELPYRERDLERAKALLAEAGAEGMTVDLWFTDDSLTAEMIASAKADLEELGLKVNMMRRDNPALRQAIYNGQADIYFWSWWLDYPDIENALVPPFHSRNIPYGGNGCHFSNPAYDRLVEHADATSDPAERIRLFQQAEDLLIEEVPWIPLYHRKTYYVAQPWVRNYRPAVMYNAGRFERVDIDLGAKRP